MKTLFDLIEEQELSEKHINNIIDLLNKKLDQYNEIRKNKYLSFNKLKKSDKKHIMNYACEKHFDSEENTYEYLFFLNCIDFEIYPKTIQEIFKSASDNGYNFLTFFVEQ